MSYIFVFFVCLNLLNIWFSTDIRAHVFSVILRIKISDSDSLENYLIAHGHTKVAELISCPLCFGTWLTLAVSVATWLASDAGWQLIVVSTLCYPSLAHWLMTKLSRDN